MRSDEIGIDEQQLSLVQLNQNSSVLVFDKIISIKVSHEMCNPEPLVSMAEKVFAEPSMRSLFVAYEKSFTKSFVRSLSSRLVMLVFYGTFRRKSQSVFLAQGFGKSSLENFSLCFSKIFPLNASFFTKPKTVLRVCQLQNYFRFRKSTSFFTVQECSLHIVCESA